MRPVASLPIGALALLAALCWGGARAQEPGELERLRERVLELVNQERMDRGLSALELQNELNEAAQSHAGDMFHRGYYAHVSPEGETVMDRYVEAGGSRWRLVEENIARCSDCAPPTTAEDVQQLHAGWIDSTEHRKNILAEGITHFGFGAASGKQKGLYAVETFAGPGTPRGLEPDKSATALSPDEQVSLGAKLINRARQDAGVPPLERSSALVSAAQSLLPEQGLAGFEAKALSDIGQALPPEQRGAWRQLALVAGGCGGCGTAPSAADVRFFRRQWLDNPQYEDTLLDPSFTSIGLVVRADGKGRKVAIAILGERP